MNRNRLARKSFAPFTDYVASFWPDKPGEFFAESYAMYRNNPNYLKRHAKPLFDWFEKGGPVLPKEPSKKTPAWYEPGGRLLPKRPMPEAPVLGELAKETEETFLPVLQGGLEILRVGEKREP
ncbi:MAG: hypothetical protein CV088_02620 [Nitrospira sp. LK70]|nr:hypothetical protein [Nitrospira sp. LK70]